MNAPLHPGRWPAPPPANDDVDRGDVPHELRPFIEALVDLCVQRLARRGVPSPPEENEP